MARLQVDNVQWKGRRALRVSNCTIEATILLGGGHIADFRLCGSEINTLWEAPWPTIEPHEFNENMHSSFYGPYLTGSMLSGYTGHAVAVPYFGMPAADDARKGLALHGEAARIDWTIDDMSVGRSSVSVTIAADLPVSALSIRRTLRLEVNSSILSVTERVHNRSHQPRDFQWVEHAAFGEPLLASGESSLTLSADQGITWPLGYEGHELLPSGLEFKWPLAADYDLSQPFLKDGTGFVAALRVQASANDGFIAVHHRPSALTAGYVFDARCFPWIALWEENRARNQGPWFGKTRVRGVEFGTSPLPLGLEQAKQTRRLLDTPVLTTVAGGAELQTTYLMFVKEVPSDWEGVAEARRMGERVLLSSHIGEQVLL